MRLEYFQLVDRVEFVDPVAGTIRASAEVPRQSTVFEGHFPGYPILPGVLLVECMAQTAGHLILVLEKFQRMPFLAQIEVAKLRRFVEPGTRLSISASLVHLGSGYAVTKAEVETEAGQVANAGIRFRSMPFPNPAMRDLMLEHARRLGLDAPMRA
jgi:3-hydroxyacyl-[acyl-carrier-protein] dehydratase